jgi:predicted transcriptional regulator
MKYRSRTEVVQAILESALQPTPWTKVMYDSYTSHAQMKEYIALLEERGFISKEITSTGKLLCTTKSGIKTLAQIRAVSNALAVETTGKSGSKSGK